jgi:hypothetical protein
MVCAAALVVAVICCVAGAWARWAAGVEAPAVLAPIVTAPAVIAAIAALRPSVRIETVMMEAPNVSQQEIEMPSRNYALHTSERQPPK